MKVKLNGKMYEVKRANEVLGSGRRELSLSLEGISVGGASAAVRRHGAGVPITVTRQEGQDISFGGYETIRNITRDVSDYEDVVRVDLVMKEQEDGAGEDESAGTGSEAGEDGSAGEDGNAERYSVSE